MRFILIDKIISSEAGKQIKTIKSVSLAEEYLADHFPIFPVLPGVLLLQGLIESASWLVRETKNFAYSIWQFFSFVKSNTYIEINSTKSRVLGSFDSLVSNIQLESAGRFQQSEPKTYDYKWLNNHLASFYSRSAN